MHVELLKVFAGIGTISDVMPLMYENRKLVRDSVAVAQLLYNPTPSGEDAPPYDIEKSVLLSLFSSKQSENPALYHPVFLAAFRGLAYVLEAWREEGKLANTTQVDSEFYAFYMSPAFNAIRRVEAPMTVAFDVFSSTDRHTQRDAAFQIIEINNLRKEQIETLMAGLTPASFAPLHQTWNTRATRICLRNLGSIQDTSQESERTVPLRTNADEK